MIAENSSRKLRLNREMVERVGPAILGSSGLAVLVYFAGTLYKGHGVFFAVIVLGLLLMNFCRYILVKKLKDSDQVSGTNSGSNSGSNFESNQKLLNFTTLMSGCAWGILSFSVGWLYSMTSFQNHLMQFVLAGVAQSAVSSLGPHFKLCRSFLFITVVPTGLLFLYNAFGTGEMAIGASYCLYFLFLLKQARLQANFFEKLFNVEKKLHNERDIFKTTLDAIPGPVSFIDEKLTYIFVNQALTEKLGISENQIIGKKAGFLNPHDAWTQRVTEFISGSERKKFSQMELELSKNQKRWHTISMSKAQGDIKGAVFVAIDVHAEKLLEENAHHTSKMAALGGMAAGMAHEINNPLSVVLGKVRNIRKEIKNLPGDHQALEEDLNRIDHHGDRIARIIRGLKTFSRNDSNDPMSETNLGLVIQDAIELHRERLKEAEIELRYVLQGEVMIECRAAQICQVFINLIGNAADAVESLAEKWIEIRVTPGDSEVLVRITDSGKGIAPEVVKKMMEPFFTTKSVGKGTGLGLSISKGIIETHGGELKVNSNCSNTSFEIRIPKKAHHSRNAA